MKLWTKFDKTALHMATEKENLKIIQLLLSHKQIDVNTKLIYS